MTYSKHLSSENKSKTNTKSDKEKEEELSEKVDEASIESFPASDPPAWITKEPEKITPPAKKHK